MRSSRRFGCTDGKRRRNQVMAERLAGGKRQNEQRTKEKRSQRRVRDILMAPQWKTENAP